MILFVQLTTDSFFNGSIHSFIKYLLNVLFYG